MEKVRLEIDGRTAEAAPGTTVLQAARSVGIEIPTLCDDDRLEPYGACRCAWLKLKRAGGVKDSWPPGVSVEEGLRVQTKTEKIIKIRKMIIELLWPSWQTYAQEYGVTSSRFKTGITDCSLCGRCSRYCAEIKKENKIYFKGRGIERHPELIEGAELSCRACGECFTLCNSGWIASRC
jgi:NADH dehydrogenase/NADH:ubiquinone oxidoreductase subunit G